MDNINNSTMLYDCFISSCSFIYKILKFIYEVTGIYLVWIVLHYIASHLYIKFCVPDTVTGFLLSPFMTATPHCQGLRWLMYNGANMINGMWIVLGTWLCGKLLIVNKNNA